jgi:hypothetical protein
MPIEDGTNISQTPGAFPVNVTTIRKSLHQASLTGEVCVPHGRCPHGDGPRAPQPRPRTGSDHAELSLPARSWINSTRHGIPANATTVYLGAGATGASLGTLDRAGMTVRALEPGVEINSLALGAPDITLEGFTVANLTAVPDTPLRGLTLTAMRTVLPLRLSATPRRGVIDLDGAVLDTTTVAILRHTGTVVCKGTTLCVTLEGVDHRVLGGTVRREDAAVVASIDKLTAVFGGA